MNLRAVIAKFAAPRMLADTGLAPAVDSVDDARDRLRQAHAEVTAARTRLAEARAARDRVEALASAADDAETEADRAAERASAVAKAWALSGARPDVSPGDQVLLDHATDARRRAEQARLQADGAEAALPQVGDAVAVAAADLEKAEEAVRVAVIDVLVATAATHFQTLHRLHDEAEHALMQLAGLREILSNWGPQHPWGRFASIGTGTDLAMRLRAAWPVIPDGRSTRATADRWAELGAALFENPDAKFSR